MLIIYNGDIITDLSTLTKEIKGGLSVHLELVHGTRVELNIYRIAISLIPSESNRVFFIREGSYNTNFNYLIKDIKCLTVTDSI